MFAGFNLLIEDVTFSEYGKIGEAIFEENKMSIKESLDKYFNASGSLNGTALQEDWFPQLEFDIFLSHSHKDEQKAKNLAGWIYKKFGLKVFIDSCVWSYSLDLQKIIDDLFCQTQPKQTPVMYSYEKVMYSTSHIHMMLSTALTMMIDKSESVFLLNTPHVIRTQDTIDKTESPWIYHEIAMTKLVRKHKLSYYRDTILKKASVQLNEYEERQLRITYDVDTSHLIPLNESDLTMWLKDWDTIKRVHSRYKVQKPLDELYRRKKLLMER